MGKFDYFKGNKHIQPSVLVGYVIEGKLCYMDNYGNIYDENQKPFKFETDINYWFRDKNSITMKTFETKKLKLYVIETEDGIVLKNIDGTNYADSKTLINSCGGIDGFLSRCKDRNETIEDFRERIEQENIKKIRDQQKSLEGQRKRDAEQQQRILEEIKEFEERYINSNIILEPTYENISMILKYAHNSSCVELPQMKVGYHCDKYDCDGKPATTLILNHTIYFDELECEESKFECGAPKGHLKDYRKIRI